MFVGCYDCVWPSYFYSKSIFLGEGAFAISFNHAFTPPPKFNSSSLPWKTDFVGSWKTIKPLPIGISVTFSMGRAVLVKLREGLGLNEVMPDWKTIQSCEMLGKVFHGELPRTSLRHFWHIIPRLERIPVGFTESCHNFFDASPKKRAEAYNWKINGWNLQVTHFFK